MKHAWVGSIYGVLEVLGYTGIVRNIMPFMKIPTELVIQSKRYEVALTWYPKMKAMAVTTTRFGTGESLHHIFTQPRSKSVPGNEWTFHDDPAQWLDFTVEDIHWVRAHPMLDYVRVLFKTPRQISVDRPPVSSLFLFRDDIDEVERLQACVKRLRPMAARRRLAVAMGAHRRLGGDSIIYLLTHEVLDRHVLPLIF